MSWFKCSLILMMITSHAFAARFTSDECLKSSFDATVEHEGKFFGLIKNKLDIKKNECLIEVQFKNILETKWVVDLCREPIHMKVHSKGSESVFKRSKKCVVGDQSDFCVYRNELGENLQDYGLIFAKGERESLSTDHGKTYCTYLLLKQHLDEGVLFSKYRTSINLFSDKTHSAPILKKSESRILKSEVVEPAEVLPSIKITTPKENSNQF